MQRIQSHTGAWAHVEVWLTQLNILKGIERLCHWKVFCKIILSIFVLNVPPVCLAPEERQTKLEGGDPAPGSHEVLLSGQLEVWSAGFEKKSKKIFFLNCLKKVVFIFLILTWSAGWVVRHDHVDVPGQHCLPQLLLVVRVSGGRFEKRIRKIIF